MKLKFRKLSLFTRHQQAHERRTRRGRRRAHRLDHACDENCRDCKHRRACTLREVPVGRPAVIRGYLEKMPENRRAQLMAYGLLPGQQVRVCQQMPVTVIQIDYTELAMEGELADAVQVDLD